MKNSTLWLWVFWICAACLPKQQKLDGADAEVTVESLVIADQRGGRWDESGIPRAPRFEVVLDRLPSHPEGRVWLLAGAVDEETEEDLLDPPLRQATEQRVVEIAIEERGDRTLTMEPVGRLVAGERYTLVVVEGVERLWAREVVVSRAAAAGAGLVESFPADQARGVAPNLAGVLLRFDGYLDAREGVVELGVEGAGASSSASTSTSTTTGASKGKARGTIERIETEIVGCAGLGLPEGDCVWVRPIEGLPEGAAIGLSVTGLRDATGAGIEPIAIAFHTGEEADEHEPGLGDLSCALDERVLSGGGCVLEQDDALYLRFAVLEPVLATVTLAHQARSVLSVGASIELALHDLKPGTAYPSSLTLTDLAGHTTRMPLALGTVDDLATISIDEVRGDPLGAEPAQESIELFNFGGEPLQIKGFFVSDDASKPGVPIVDDLSVLPGERVLVVGPKFDPRDMSDGVLSPGVRLVHTDKALSISNTGEALYLRDARGRRLSSAPSMGPAHSGACIARIVDDPRTGAAHSFAHDPESTCTPGRETSWP